MAILVTRPQQEGQALCNLLGEHQIDSCHQPLFTINQGQDYANALEALAQADKVIFVSRYAVQFLAQRMREDNAVLPTHIKYFAIGQSTAKEFAQTFSQAIKYPQVSDSEHLLALPELADVQGQRIVIFRGNSGRELIFQTLQQQGAKIQYNAIYQRQAIAFDSKQAVKNWRKQPITGIIVTSGESLDYLIQTLQGINEFDWLLGLTLFVPSKRIQCYALTLGFTNVINTQGASNVQLIEAIKKMHKMDSNYGRQ